jgi:hypothetical protein
MKSYWIAVGLGTLVAAVGAVVWTISDEQFGLILVLSGLVIAILGAVMRIVEWAMAKGKRSAAN